MVSLTIGYTFILYAAMHLYFNIQALFSLKYDLNEADSVNEMLSAYLPKYSAHYRLYIHEAASFTPQLWLNPWSTSVCFTPILVLFCAWSCTSVNFTQVSGWSEWKWWINTIKPYPSQGNPSSLNGSEIKSTRYGIHYNFDTASCRGKSNLGRVYEITKWRFLGGTWLFDMMKVLSLKEFSTPLLKGTSWNGGHLSSLVHTAVKVQ